MQSCSRVVASLIGICLALLFGHTHAVAAEPVRILNATIRPDGRIELQHTSNTNSYYILRRGESVSAILTPKDMQLGQDKTGKLNDPDVLPHTAFYRVQEVLLTASLDTDADGIDDLCELKYAPTFDPLEPNLADADPDNDGRSTREECASGTNPLLSNIPAIPVIEYPTNATQASFVFFTGTAQTNTLIRIEGGAAYVTNQVDAQGKFTAEVPLRENRLNRLFVSSMDEFGVSSPLAPIDILQDSTPPNLFIDVPTNNTKVTAESILVAGRIGDSLSGFLGLSVKVNGEPATVDVGIGPNGTFQRGQVPLALGTNQIQVIASDRLGNTAPRTVTVIREAPAGPRLLIVSGDLQKTNILRRLPLPLVVKATQGDGSPLANKLLSFQVTRSDGRLLPVQSSQLASDMESRPDYSTNGTMFLQLTTDAQGEASVWYRMGIDAGHANNRVSVSAADIKEPVSFCADALALPARQVNIGSGNNQRGEIRGPAPEPLKVWVSDGNNPVKDIPVTFKVVQGGGNLVPIVTTNNTSPAGPGLRASRPVGSIAIKMLGARNAPEVITSSEVTVLTSITGHAEVDFTFGPEAGNQIVEASFPGNIGLPATFVLNALARVPGQPTTFSGIVFDNTSQPVVGAYCELTVAGATNKVATDSQGRFAFQNLPSGCGHLYVNGATATMLGTNTIPTNSFPSLQYSLVMVPNAENTLPSPVLLPRLNTNNARLYYGTNDLVLTCEGIDGLKMTIKANTMKLPNGQIVNESNPTWVSLNQVHHDQIPMPMPDGASPPFAWTLQPGGCTFTEPVKVEYPNMSGLAPGAAAYFLTFNHDTERFEIVASGHVTEDGSTIMTDPGAGITISGWGCNCPPYSVTGKCTKCLIQFVTPYGDPDFEPNSTGEGQNEFTFNGSSPGELEITFIAEPCPDASEEDIEEIKDRVRFSVDTLEGAALVWDSSSPAGKAYYLEGRWFAKVKFVGLPSKNSNFGRKSVIASVDGFDITSTGYYEVFYQRDSFNYPGAKGSIPNWFFYWIQTPASKNANVIYKEDLKSFGDLPAMTDWLTYAGPRDQIRMARATIIEERRDGSGQKASGIDWFANVVNHELVHVDQLKRINALDFFRGATGALRNAPHSGWYFVTLDDPYLKNPYESPYWNWFRDLDRDGRYTPGLGEGLDGFRVNPPNGYPDEIEHLLPPECQGSKDVFECEAYKAENIKDNTFRVYDWGDPGKMHGLPDFDDSQAANQPSSNQFDKHSVRKYLASKRLQSKQVLDADKWTFQINGHFSVASSEKHFEISNISSPDAFGPNGPGSPPDFIGDDYVRLTGHNVFNDRVRYAFSDFFKIHQGKTIGIPNLTVTDLPPLKPETLRIILGSNTARIAQKVQLAVLAHLFDGTEFDVTKHDAWTSYRVSNPKIASVSQDGEVTPLSLGVAHITAVNEGASAVIGLNVIGRSDGFTTVSGTILDSGLIPKPGVSVRIYGINASVVETDASGQFRIANVPNTLGPLALTARLVVGGQVYMAAVRLDSIAEEHTSAGVLTLELLPPERTRIAAGGSHSIALRSDDTLWGWGQNGLGQLGRGDFAHAASPELLQLDASWRAVAAGNDHTLAIRGDGTLWAWGWNNDGQVGNGVSGGPVLTAQLIQSNALWKAASAGNAHSVAMRMDRSLWTWGDNDYGQLGNNSKNSTNSPQPVQPETAWDAIAAGGYHTLAIRADGSLWGWGRNNQGQLGNGSLSSPLVPVSIQPNMTWKTITGGELHSAGIRTDGSLWTWGFNESGQLGNGNYQRRTTPQPIQPGWTWLAVSAGANHTMAIRSDGTLWAWGESSFGQLGVGAFPNPNTPQPVRTKETWVAVSAGRNHTIALRSDGTLFSWGRLPGYEVVEKSHTPRAIQVQEKWVAISAGEAHSVAVRADRTIWTWGANAFGELGHGSLVFTDTPQSIESSQTWQSVSAGDYFTLGLETNGALWGAGHNDVGQLAESMTFIVKSLFRMAPIGSWKGMSAGSAHTVALQSDGTLWTWGDNFMGQLGDGTQAATTDPKKVGGNSTWLAMSAGNAHTVALQSDGTLWAWGSNNRGQLGDGTFDKSSIPRQIGEESAWADIAAGHSHTIALKSDGTLWAWGANSVGELGIGGFTGTSPFGVNTPQKVNNANNWKAITAGGHHTLALKKDGTLWAWGANSEGQLGIGNFTTSSPSGVNIPSMVIGNAKWKAVEAGTEHTLALQEDGSLWAWGKNDDGQIAQPVSWLPYPVSGGADWGIPK